jgi:hypothetical protein
MTKENTVIPAIFWRESRKRKMDAPAFAGLCRQEHSDMTVQALS